MRLPEFYEELFIASDLERLEERAYLRSTIARVIGSMIAISVIVKS